MAKNVTVTWDLPTTRTSGFPLDPADIAGVELTLSGDGGANFIPLVTVLPIDPQSHQLFDVDIGDYILRLVVVDTSGKRSADHDEFFNIPDETNPEVVTNVTVMLV